MERELWPPLYHLVMRAGRTLRLIDVTYQPHIVVLVFFWAALHDRPVRWACDERNWATTTLRPARIPSAATMSRRLRRLDTALLMRKLVDLARGEGDPRLIAVVDAKPLPVGGASGDPEARCGRGAGMWARGYKLYAVWAGRPAPEAHRVYAMNASEDKVAEEMVGQLGWGGYLLGDGEYDANGVFDAAGAAGYQLLAPREDPQSGLGHHYQSPYRLRCIALLGSRFGREIYRLRGSIERRYGVLTSFGCGLSPLPAWVRHRDRVWLWTSAKLVINAVRISERKGLTA
jgi:Transposase DDE domain